jgi:hypothetical protein
LTELTNQPTNQQKKTKSYEKLAPKFSIFEEDEKPAKLFSPNLSPIQKREEGFDISLHTLIQEKLNASTDSPVSSEKKKFRRKSEIQPIEINSLIFWDDVNISGLVFCFGCLIFALIHLNFSPLSIALNFFILCILFGTCFSRMKTIYTKCWNSIKKKNVDSKVESAEFNGIDIRLITKYSKICGNALNFSLNRFHKIIIGEDLMDTCAVLMALGIFSYLTFNFGWNTVLFIIWVFSFTYPLATSPENIEFAHSQIFGTLNSLYERIAIVVNKTIYRLSK